VSKNCRGDRHEKSLLIQDGDNPLHGEESYPHNHERGVGGGGQQKLTYGEKRPITNDLRSNRPGKDASPKHSLEPVGNLIKALSQSWRMRLLLENHGAGKVKVQKCSGGNGAGQLSGEVGS